MESTSIRLQSSSLGSVGVHRSSYSSVGRGILSGTSWSQQVQQPSRSKFAGANLRAQILKSGRKYGVIFGALPTQAEVATSTFQDELANIDWDDLGFGLKQTDYMYIMKCGHDGVFSGGDLFPFGNIELSPSAGVLNYGQGLFEGLKAYRRADGRIVLFRPEQNALRLTMGAERMCLPAPSVEQFVEAVKQTVLANKRWIPPFGKGSLYIRPLLLGSGAVLGLAPAPEVTFLIYVSPVGNYFKEGLAPIQLQVETKYHRATPGGTGNVKTIGNYAPVLKVQRSAKVEGFSDVLYLDAINKKYLEEVSSCNIFVVKGYRPRLEEGQSVDVTNTSSRRLINQECPALANEDDGSKAVQMRRHFKGVSFHKKSQEWEAYIMVPINRRSNSKSKKKKLWLGIHCCEEASRRTCDKAQLALLSPSDRDLNYPQDDYEQDYILSV